MEDKFNPYDAVKMATTMKYKAMLLPVSVIILCFFFNLYDSELFSSYKYVSILAFLYYIWVLFIYRYPRNSTIEDPNLIFSPVTGIVTEIRENKDLIEIVIKKSYYHSSDFRYPFENTVFNAASVVSKDSPLPVGVTLISRKVKMFQDNFKRTIPGALIGLVPGNAVCQINIPKEYILTCELKEKVVAGISFLAKVKNTEGEI